MKRAMAKRAVVIALWLAVASASQTALAQFDRIRIASGQVQGTITEMSQVKVVMETNGVPRDFEVNTILSVVFKGEPKELTGGREMVRNGKFDEARKLLEKIDTSTIERAEVKLDVEYYIAYAMGRLALGGSGDPKKAQERMFQWVKDAKKASWHYLEACELLGNLASSAGAHEDAKKFYAEVAKAPWPDYQMRATVLLGQALQMQKDPDKQKEALAQFEKALAMSVDTDEGKRQILSATLGKAVSMAELGQEKDAVALVEKVIADAAPEEVDLHAKAYNALGTCRLKLGDNKAALLAYLHVDLLYFGNPEAHAESLAQLAKLWPEIGQTDRGREATALLKSRYPNSQWNK